MKFEPTLHKLSNGITVILDPMDLETVNIKVFFATGARDENPNEYGITHFCEHMLGKGTERFPTAKIIKEYFDVNAGIRNAGTGIRDVIFYGRILEENINVLIDFLGDQIRNSLFLPEKIEIERKVISDELRRLLDSPADQLNKFISDKLFNGAGSSGVKIAGTFENINSFTRDQMLDFISRRFSAKNCIIGISGKISDSEKVLESLEKSFGWLKSFDVFENSEINYTPTIAHNSKSDNKNVKLRIFFPDIWERNFDNIIKNMCVGKFERHLSEKLFEILRHQNGLIYSSGMTSKGNEKFSLNGIATETSIENMEKLVSLIAKNSYKIYSENGITDEDLKRYSLKNKLGDADWLESSASRCDKLIGFYNNFGKIYDFYEAVRMSDSLNHEDVIKNSRGYFDGEMSIITQGAEFDLDLKSVWEENFK